MIQVIPVPALRDNYIWLTQPSGKRSPDQSPATTVIVDPGDATPVLAALAAHRLLPSAILITHHHSDHVGGVPELLRYFPIPVFAPQGARISTLDHPLSEGDAVPLGNGLDLRVIEVPGHTHDHIAYYGSGMLFCGDTLFTGGCGRLFEGTARQLHTSLQKLAALPDETRIYCGHEYTLSNLRFASQVEPDNRELAARLVKTLRRRSQNSVTASSTLAEEKATNPFLRCHIAAVRQAAERFCGNPLNTDTDVFAMIRSWKDTA